MPIRFPSCPICAGEALLWRELNGHRIERCRACGFGYVNPRPGREVIAEMYRTEGGHCASTVSLRDALEAERRAPNSTVDARRIVGMLARATGGGRLLDVGCGYGFFSAEASNAGFDVDALEIAPVERAAAAELLGKEPLALEFEDLLEDSTYDAILMSQVLEHAVDPRSWIAKAARLLRPGGVLAVAVPSFESLLRRILQERDPYVDPPVHLNYFGPGNLRTLLAEEGLVTFRSETFSRVRADALSKRMGVQGAAQRVVDAIVRQGQRPLLRAADRAGLGFFLHVYAQREEGVHSSVSAQRQRA